MGGETIFEPFELQFSDLLLLSDEDPAVSSLSHTEIERLDVVSDGVMDALGPSGPGLLCVVGIPEVSDLRSELLPLARKLALLDNKDRARILEV